MLGFALRAMTRRPWSRSGLRLVYVNSIRRQAASSAGLLASKQKASGGLPSHAAAAAGSGRRVSRPRRWVRASSISVRPRGLEPPRTVRSTRPSTGYGGCGCVRGRPDRPFRAGFWTYWTGVWRGGCSQRVLPGRSVRRQSVPAARPWSHDVASFEKAGQGLEGRALASGVCTAIVSTWRRSRGSGCRYESSRRRRRCSSDAAAASHLNVSAFNDAAMAAAFRAEEVLAERQSIRLTPEAAQAFTEALDGPLGVNERLARALKRPRGFTWLD